MNSPHFPGTRALVTAALVALFPGCMTVDTKPTIENRFSGPGPIVSAPAESADRAYLGLRPEVTTFQLSDVQSELIVVEKFDMYCHSCQTAAKYVRELFELVENRELGDRIKFIGVGVGNTPLETNTFRRKFKLQFPALADRDGELSSSLGGLRVPSLIVLRNRPGRLEIVHRSSGIPRDPESLLDRILEAARREAALDESDASSDVDDTCDPDDENCLPDSEFTARILDA